jgi:NACHT domain
VATVEEPLTSSRTASEPPAPWRVRLCRWLWQITVSIGGFIIFGLGGNVLATLLISPKTPSNSPLWWLVDRWIIVLPIGMCFLLLALLFRVGSRWPIRNLAPPASPDDKNRAFVLQRLRRNYCDLMEQSLQDAAWLILGFAHKPDAVQNTTALLLRQSNRPERLLPPGTSIQQVYKEANGELLILGEPGSGKSTQLYALALHLVEQADSDQAQPLPVVFSLSSWAAKRLSLEKWMEEQLASPLYSVPRHVSRQWVQNEQILPLLDGLDEMNETIRPDCIAAINTYHRNHLHPLVVCSRSAEYAVAAVSERIALESAVVVQPLGKAQVETMLAQGDKKLAALRAVYKKNVALQELATMPLMLNLLILTYQGVQVRDLPTKGDVLQQQLLTGYVQRMVKLKEGYLHQQTCSWLHWPAGQMRLHQQTLFILEQLQPDWLPQQVRTLYHGSIRMIGVPFFGLLVGLFGGLFGAPIGMFIEVLTSRPIDALTSGLLFGLVLGVPSGLVGGLLYGQGNTIKVAEKLAWSWKEARKGLIVGLPVGLVGGPFGALIGGRLTRPPGALVGGLIGGLFSGLCMGLLIFQLNDAFQFFPQEGYRHSLRKGVFIGLLVGALAGSLIGLLEALFTGLELVEKLLVGLISGLAGGSIGGLFVGFSNTQLNSRFPLLTQEKYRRSMRNRLLVGLLGGLLVVFFFGLILELLVGVLFNPTGGLFRELLIGLLGGPTGGLIAGLISGFPTFRQLNNDSRVLPHEGYRRSKRYALVGGVLIGLPSGLLFGLTGGLLFGLTGGLLFGLLGGLTSGLLFGWFFGLSAATQHDVLRFQLWRAQLFPWDAVDFLENARARHLLVRVGGSYSFIHQLLLNYFADLNPESASVSTRPVAMQAIQSTPPAFSE